MAFPVVESVTQTVIATNETSHAVDMPATVNSGDLLLTFFGNDGDATVSTPSGWTQLWSNASGVDVRLTGYYRIADGTEGGTTVTFTTSAGETSTDEVYRISGWHGTTAPEVGTATDGNSVNPDPPSLTPSWGSEDTLWIAVMSNDQGNNTIDAYPTNYTDGTFTTTGNPGGCTTGSARRALAASSEDPGTFTLSATKLWVAQTVAIRPTGVGEDPDNVIAFHARTALYWSDNS